MKGRIVQLWRLRHGRAGTPEASAVANDPALDGASDSLSSATTDGPETHGAGEADGPVQPGPGQLAVARPEQPVLLSPVAGARPVHVGELLPARHRRWPLRVLRLPTVPKRAILAAGVCAGLAAPTLARHFATRMLLGRSGSHAEGLIEITRIVYTGPLTPRAASAITKVLEAGRR